MADLRLDEFVLLECHFELRPLAGEEDEVVEYPEEDLIKLSATTTREDDSFLLLLRGVLDTDQLPFQLDVLVGARYSVQGEPMLQPEEVQATLVFLCYPYLRELVSSVIARSPSPPYMLPPLTRLPHPSVLEEGSTD